MVVLSVVIFVLLVANISWAEPVGIISGYEAKEYAIKEKQEQQLKSFIEGVKMICLRQGEYIQFKIEGFADKSGVSSENDEYARKRAETVREYLLANFPEAKANAYSRGDSANIREVHIYVLAVNAPVTGTINLKPDKEKDKSEFIAFMTATFGVLVILIIFAVYRLRMYQKNRKPKEKEEFSWVSAYDCARRIITIKVEKRNGMWYAPLVVDGRPLERDNREQIKKATQLFSKHEKYLKQLEEAVAKKLAFYKSKGELREMGIIKPEEA
jgi:hypothetical protein